MDTETPPLDLNEFDILVLDTTEIFKDYWLGSFQIRILFEFLPSLGISIAIPEVVLEEHKTHFREKIKKEYNGLYGNIQRLEQTARKIISRPVDESWIEKIEDSHEKQLNSRLDECSVEILPLPNIEHRDLIKRDLARRKPFSRSGKGYRDSLIWEEILELAPRIEKKVGFISNNSDDFGKGELHPDLVKDLVDAGHDPDKVVLIDSLTEFVKTSVLPQLPKPSKDIIEFMLKADPQFNWELVVADQVENALENREFSSNEIGAPPEFDSITVVAVNEVDDLEIYSDAEPEEGMRLIGISGTADCTFDFLINKRDVSNQFDEMNIEVWNTSLSEDLMHCSFSGMIHFEAYLELDINNKSVGDFEITTVSVQTDIY